ncbi:hypothetical protein [Desulfovibrio inopinatus]|uniref:hypothetical protein n=1 Tax=Desulfovibrio inopinatus TaxID=102109 RepID=UPI00040B23FD|nr:hypothetical protein [Desulfovibrio inopinatus]
MQVVTKDALRTGDIFLYHSESFLGGMIRLFDGSEYNHAGIFDGENVIESLGGGITTNTISESTCKNKFVDVFRFRNDAGKQLGDAGIPTQNVTDTIRRYVNDGDRYAFEQILLLAALATTRRFPFGGWVPGLSKFVRQITDAAASVLSKLMSMNKEPLICSELVYRCYVESGEEFFINIVGADILAQRSIGHTSTTLTHQFDISSQKEMSSTVMQDFEEAQLASYEFLETWQRVSRTAPLARSVPDVQQNEVGVVQSRAIADFVTPRDLKQSPNTYIVGRLAL